MCEGAEFFEVKEVAGGKEVAERRGWPRRACEDEADAEQDEVVEVDEDNEGR